MNQLINKVIILKMGPCRLLYFLERLHIMYHRLFKSNNPTFLFSTVYVDGRLVV